MGELHTLKVDSRWCRVLRINRRVGGIKYLRADATRHTVARKTFTGRYRTFFTPARYLPLSPTQHHNQRCQSSSSCFSLMFTTVPLLNFSAVFMQSTLYFLFTVKIYVSKLSMQILNFTSHIPKYKTASLLSRVLCFLTFSFSLFSFSL